MALSFFGKRLYVARAQKKSERRQELQQTFQSSLNPKKGTNLYVKNLDDEVTDTMLTDEFKKFGTITSAVVMKEKGVSRGFGFINFSTPEEANKALNEMNNKQVWAKPLYVSFAQRKEERRAFLESQYRVPRRQINVLPPQIYPPFTQPNIPLMYPPIIRNPQGRWNQQMPSPYPQSGLPYIGIQQQQGQPIRSNAPIRQYPPSVASGRAIRRDKPVEEPLTLEYLKQYAPEHQFLMVSQKLYPIIMKQQPELAPKITGMLRSWYLEHHQAPEELLRLVEDPAALNAKIQEAMEIWEEHIRSTSEVAQDNNLQSHPQ